METWIFLQLWPIHILRRSFWKPKGIVLLLFSVLLRILWNFFYSTAASDYILLHWNSCTILWKRKCSLWLWYPRVLFTNYSYTTYASLTVSFRNWENVNAANILEQVWNLAPEKIMSIFLIKIYVPGFSKSSHSNNTTTFDKNEHHSGENNPWYLSLWRHYVTLTSLFLTGSRVRSYQLLQFSRNRV